MNTSWLYRYHIHSWSFSYLLAFTAITVLYDAFDLWKIQLDNSEVLLQQELNLVYVFFRLQS